MSAPRLQYDPVTHHLDLVDENAPAPRVCIECGCSDERPCVTDQGVCAWAELDPPVCSRCFFEREADCAIARLGSVE